jgi:hypothetical protein
VVSTTNNNTSSMPRTCFSVPGAWRTALSMGDVALRASLSSHSHV